MRYWFVVALALAGCSSTAFPQSAASPTTVSPVPATRSPASRPAGHPVTVRGDGQENTAPFQLDGGDYTARMVGTGDCVYDATLNPLESNPLFEGDVGSLDTVGATQTHLYGLTAGRYYVAMITGPAPACGWTVTLTPS